MADKSTSSSSGSELGVRKSSRLQGKSAEYPDGVGITRRQRKTAATRKDDLETRSNAGSVRSHTSRVSTTSTTARRKLEAEMEALRQLGDLDEEEDELRQEAEARKVQLKDLEAETEARRVQLLALEAEVDRKKVTRKKLMVEKELELAKARIDEEEEFNTCYADNNSQDLSDEDIEEVPEDPLSSPDDQIREKRKPDGDAYSFTLGQRAENLRGLHTEKQSKVEAHKRTIFGPVPKPGSDVCTLNTQDREEIQKWLQTGERRKATADPAEAFQAEVQHGSSLPHPTATQPTEQKESVLTDMEKMMQAMTTAFQNMAGSQIKEPQNMKKYLARQTVAKELPSFSGDPVEWPNFISQYKATTEACEFSNIENIARLQKSLRGKAKDAVQCMLAVPEKLPDVMKCLEENFGRPDVILKMLTDRAERMSNVRDEKPDALMDLANSVRNLTSTAEILNKKEYLANPYLMEKLTEKLSPAMRREWGMKVVQKDEGTSRLQEFSSWLDVMARAVRAVTLPHSSCGQEERKENRQKGRDGRRGAVFSTIEEKKKPTKCEFCGKPGHNVSSCRLFAKKTSEERWAWTVEHQLCFTCLDKDHRSANCPKKKKCTKEGCEMYHHPLLHVEQKKTTPKEENALVSYTTKESMNVPLCVLPVIVNGPKGDVHTYAMLDCASTVTLMDADLATQIGVTGPKSNLNMQWINAAKKVEADSMQVNVKIKGKHCHQTYNVENVRTAQHLALPLERVNVKAMKTTWKHLRKVPLPNLQDVQPRLLIGLNNARLIVALEVVEGPPNAPMAVRTRLGWSLFGNSGEQRGRVDEGFVCHVFRKPDDVLHQMVKDSYRIEDLGVKVSDDNLMSREDKRTREITEATTRRVDGGWETGLLWKEDETWFPESKTMALNRLHGIERKMDRNPVFAERYCEKIQEYVTKGFARKLTQEEVEIKDPKTWYLPHFAVFNPNKPKKFRLVFDAAARTRGVCLNDRLLKGLDLLQPLPSVLCKFRQRKIAFGADIKDMFHRVKIRKEDLPAQRFLWRGMDRKMPPHVYQMDVMIFGAVSSPYSAQEVKNRNVMTLEPPASGEAQRAIVDRHYMDDYLDSCSTEEEAQQLILEVIDIHRRGGFEICNWICSEPKVLNAIPKKLRAEIKDVVSMEGEPGYGEEPTERVLGLYWDPKRDVFVFTTKLKKIEEDIVSGRKAPTKREALSLVMSVFDPLGFLTHLIIKAKILLQDVWRSDTGWDDEIRDLPLKKWMQWLRDLHAIKKFYVPRCYYSKMSEKTDVSMHVFCDASEQAYAAVAYLRMKNDGEDVECAFVMGKSRVAPLNPSSIPRMELQAALLGVRMARTIKEYHDIPIREIHYWTDSSTVLCWIRSDGRRYKPYVAHRIGEILEESDVKNWHWVPTKENVADEATRDGCPTDTGPKSRWLTGPTFLRKPPGLWPMEKGARETSPEVNDQDLELKREFVALLQQPEGVFPDIERFASWWTLIRSTAWMLRFIDNAQKKCRQGQLTVNEVYQAELRWLRQVQAESFAEEIACLRKGRVIPIASRLKQLIPMMDDKGLLVLKGRINEAADVGAYLRHPIILDPKNKYTKLLLQYIHEKAGHHGVERVLNDVRMKYWILDLRAALKRTTKSCQYCRVRKAVPENPEMGQLPACRVNRQARPFTFTGLDYFGPMEVTVGRRHEKRYGALFTCLTTRAVHLELAASLDTDSCIMAIRRFMARRGAPKEIWSDNGTNFHGADNELKKALKEIDQGKMTGELSAKGVDWKFIPPSAPHMGGCWERMVRSVKTALNAVLNCRAPKEEVLQTLLVEAEHTVNSRPLTHVSDDPEDIESLTPNHFLLGGPSGVRHIGEFTEADLFTRKNWKNAQRLADMFWKRWVKEYLPTLTKRTKDSGRRNPIQVGDLVFIADGDLKRNSWPRGVVEKVFPGKDGVVRVVEIRTATGTFKRPVVKVCVIDVTKEVDVPQEASTGGSMLSTHTTRASDA